MHTGVEAVDVEDLVTLLHDAEEDDQLVRDALSSRRYEVYSARLGGRLVGAAVVEWRHGPESEILYIAVDAQRRGQGFGRAILEHLKTELHSRGGRLVVGTANSSLDNIAFYQRCGFRMHAVKRGYFDYVQPGVTEFDIPLRDMIVFAYEAPPTFEPGNADPVDAASLDGVDFLLIPGSTRSASRNHAVLRAVNELAPRSVIYDGLARLPQFEPDADPASNDEVVALRAMLAAADVVVISTPEYAGTLPGSMKNLIDWTVGTADLYQKPVAWINVAPTGRGMGASDDLARILGYVDAQVLVPGGLQLPLDPAWVGAHGNVLDEEYRARLLRGVVHIGQAYQQARSR
jgi:NAD(P)H-dependent FMN reductase/GNAT superfamily N-acetyltransferase